MVLQDSVIARQEEEMSSLKGQIGVLQQQMTLSADKSIDLMLKASGAPLAKQSVMREYISLLCVAV